MAEIPVVQKPRSRAAPFVIVLILLLVAAGAWYWWSSQPAVTQTGARAASGEVIVLELAARTAEVL